LLKMQGRRIIVSAPRLQVEKGYPILIKRRTLKDRTSSLVDTYLAGHDIPYISTVSMS
jgi:hypothetical protein